MIPEDVKKLASNVVVKFLDGPVGRPQAEVLRDMIAEAIMSDRASRLPHQADEIRKAALEKALHVAQKEMAVLHVCRNYELASEDEYQSLRKVIAAIRALSQKGEADG